MIDVCLKRGFVDARAEANDQINPKRLKTASSSCLDISADCFLSVFGFLSPEEVALAERISKAWQRTINAKNQVIWKQQYLRFFPEANVLSGEGSETTYKKLLVPVYGNVWLCFDSFPFLSPDQNIDRGQKEPVLYMKVKLKADKRNSQTEFYQDFPLRCLIKTSGNNYKNSSDKIKLLWPERRMILTCINRDYRIYSFRSNVSTFVAGAIKQGKITKENVAVARALAKTSSEWIRSVPLQLFRSAKKVET